MLVSVRVETSVVKLSVLGSEILAPGLSKDRGYESIRVFPTVSEHSDENIRHSQRGHLHNDQV